MDAAAIFERVSARFPDDVSDFTPAVEKDGPRDAFFRVKPTALLAVFRQLRDDESLRFDFLQNLTAVDWPKQDRIEVVYHLHSYTHRHEIVVKVALPRAAPRVSSIASLYKIADWLEREQYDLLGVIFEGHPDLRRLLLPDDWVGHPMRKDWKEPKSYRGMPTTRHSPIDLIGLYDKEHAPRPAAPPPKPEGDAS